VSNVKAQKGFLDTKICYAKVVVKDTLEDPGELGKMILNLDNVGHINEEGSIEVSCDVDEHRVVRMNLIDC